MFKFLCALLVTLGLCSAFQTQKSARSATSLLAKSKSVPFLEQQPALASNIPGNVGFDPLGLSGLWADRDWSEQIVPGFWNDPTRKTKISTIDWMREAEIKHGRYAMMAIIGWLAVDAGIRFPGDAFSTSAIANSLVAHDPSIANGSMGFMLNFVSVCELISGAAIYDMARGSGRQPGDFTFDPLNLSKDAKSRERYATNEIKNGRLAMLAFGGLVTQAALFPDKAFPFF